MTATAITASTEPPASTDSSRFFREGDTAGRRRPGRVRAKEKSGRRASAESMRRALQSAPRRAGRRRNAPASAAPAWLSAAASVMAAAGSCEALFSDDSLRGEGSPYQFPLGRKQGAAQPTPTHRATTVWILAERTTSERRVAFSGAACDGRTVSEPYHSCSRPRVPRWKRGTESQRPARTRAAHAAPRRRVARAIAAQRVAKLCHPRDLAG